MGVATIGVLCKKVFLTVSQNIKFVFIIELDNNLSLQTSFLFAYSVCTFNPYVTNVYIQFLFQEAIYCLLRLFPGFVFPLFYPINS